MAYDDEFNQELEFQREDYYSRKMECCANCGSKEVSCTAGNEAFCGDCFRERSAEKAARRASVAQPAQPPTMHQTKLEGLQRDCYEWLIRADTRTENGATRTMGSANAENLAPKLEAFVLATLRQKLSEGPKRDIEMDALRFQVSQLTDRLARERNANGIRMSVAQVYEENPRGYRNLLQIQSVRHETEGLFIEVRGAALATLRQKPAQPPKMKGEWRLVEEYKPEGRDISFRMSYFLEGCTTPVWTFWAKWDGCFTLISHANGSTIHTTDECDDDMHFCGGGWDGIRALMEIQALGEKRFGKEYWGKK